MSLPQGVEMSHIILERFLSPGDRALDATCGNGHDTAFLARQVGSQGRVLAIDIQEEAVKNTRRRLEEEGLAERAVVIRGDHSRLLKLVQTQSALQTGESSGKSEEKSGEIKPGKIEVKSGESKSNKPEGEPGKIKAEGSEEESGETKPNKPENKLEETEAEKIKSGKIEKELEETEAGKLKEKAEETEVRELKGKVEEAEVGELKGKAEEAEAGELKEKPEEADAGKLKEEKKETGTEADRLLKFQAVVFNLGFLPGSAKEIITTAKTTLPALEQSRQLLDAGGVIVIVSYTGHQGGERECRQLLDWAGGLDYQGYNVLHHRFINQPTDPPQLIAVEKR